MERYIGITGFKTGQEIKACEMVSSGLEPIIMYGVLTTQKMLMYPEREGTRRPSFYDLPKILEVIPSNSLPTLHHCGNNRQFTTELDKILAYENIYDRGLCKAVQINQRLPEVSELEKLKKNYPNLKIIVQLEPPDLETPKKTGKILNNYEGLAEYIIIDPSRGVGITLDPHNSLEVLNEIKINVMPVIAGGLKAENVEETIAFFRKEYGDNFCIDAEGRLRDEDDKLNLDKMTAYMKEAYKAYKK